MVGFHSFLCSVSGGAREPEAAKQIVNWTASAVLSSTLKNAVSRHPGENVHQCEELEVLPPQRKKAPGPWQIGRPQRTVQ